MKFQKVSAVAGSAARSGSGETCAASQKQRGYYCKGVPRERDLRAREGAKAVQGVRGREYLRTREAATPVQGGGARASASTGGGETPARSAGALRSASTGGGSTGARSARARDAAAPVLCPVHPKPEILVECEDVEDPGRRTSPRSIHSRSANTRYRRLRVLPPTPTPPPLRRLSPPRLRLLGPRPPLFSPSSLTASGSLPHRPPLVRLAAAPRRRTSPPARSLSGTSPTSSSGA